MDMATNAAGTPPSGNGQVNMETPISLRVSLPHGQTRKFKLPLGDLNAQVLPGKVRDVFYNTIKYRSEL